ncbi:Small heat shock protein IbpA [Vibrio stylophorae]|uniref:Small heat shock protein IbpA n=1 Tax=Vibrio stylophorae TaxID=659351 RepID=A0ABM8ZWP5_9VIBR|nr:Hsp20 family protein [Vibrio stylophorae]CAH0534768.1 Small heat shock protein IbpA [Vibrio stylophorae]
MRTIDFSPLYRSAIGFDRIFNQLEQTSSAGNGSYPPYNIEQTGEHSYRITMAVAGFSPEQLTLTQTENILKVTGLKKSQNEEKQYLYQGIAERDFERKFQLADHVKVTAADMENGLLHIDLDREIPEESKPRNIAIGQNRVLENK